jgi:hypothetical protein
VISLAGLKSSKGQGQTNVGYVVFVLKRLQERMFRVCLVRAIQVVSLLAVSELTFVRFAGAGDRLHSCPPSNAASGHGARIRNQPELFFMAGTSEWANQPAVYSK